MDQVKINFAQNSKLKFRGPEKESEGASALADFLFYFLFANIKIMSREDIAKYNVLNVKISEITDEKPELIISKEQLEFLQKELDKRLKEGTFTASKLEFLTALENALYQKEPIEVDSVTKPEPEPEIKK